MRRHANVNPQFQQQPGTDGTFVNQAVMAGGRVRSKDTNFVKSGAIISILLVIVSGCGSGTGQDFPVEGQAVSRGLVSDCTTCHNAANSPALDPLTTNGSGSSGKHIKHVQERAIACERCHSGYLSAPTHMNGTFDTDNSLVSVVSISITGPAGTWVKTGPGTGSCSGVACHGNETLDWYGTSTWTVPDSCTSCHVASYANELDPLVTNGSGSAGKHARHVTDYGIACTKCHQDYPSRSSHANGALDAQDPSVPLVWFDSFNSSGTWTNDTGPGTGGCSSLYCHGAYSGTFTYFFFDADYSASYAGNSWAIPDWYSPDGLGCDSCHGNPPTIPNSTQHYTWHSGQHANPFVDNGNECQLCHPDATSTNGIGTAITNTSLHVNGIIDVQPQGTAKCSYCH
jgi:predicted CxxxxCH...CXXCH cytochrome family protein